MSAGSNAVPPLKEVSMSPSSPLESGCPTGSPGPVGRTGASNAPAGSSSDVDGGGAGEALSSFSTSATTPDCSSSTFSMPSQPAKAAETSGDRQDTGPAFSPSSVPTPSASSSLSSYSLPSPALPSCSLSLEPGMHGGDCRRGELLLTEAEARSVEYHVKQALLSKDKEERENNRSLSQPYTRWRLQPVLPELLRPASKKTKRASSSTSTSRRGANALTELLESAGIKLEPNELAATGRPQRASRSCSSSVGNANATSAAESTSSSSHSPVSSEKQNHGDGGTVSSANMTKSPPAAVSQAQPSSHWVPPPWVCHMHRVLVELCKQSVCLPFFPRVSPGDAHYPELARKVYPAIPITLETVLDRLERNEYSRCEEVFNDVHTVFLCAFRYYEPGNQYWMMAHEASLVFHNLTHNKPLLSSDFDACSQPHKTTPDGNHTPSSSSDHLGQWGSHSGAARPGGSAVGSAASSAIGGEDAGDDFSQVGRAAAGRSDRRSARRSRRTDGGGIKSGKGRKTKSRGGAVGTPALSPADAGAGLYHPGSVPTTTVPLPSAGGSATPPLLSGSSVASASAAGGVTPQERESFQQLLGQLDMEVHLELYSVFRDRALWLSFDTGEVELDDANTAPEVFRMYTEAEEKWFHGVKPA
ncbi:bromodomain protein [Cystoisospora suis]|uniref:Bromodomain protein n=1 Tax=Cystoisospora suis TaxID=483139 RepID=A0A2C6KIM6_9APIC|nr:bromodomain protein [Cystoisospora suis]